MQVDQISYGSVKRRNMKGYQIIGKSHGVDAALSGAFCRWAPSHNALEGAPDETSEDAWALSFFPISESRFAIARTVHGGPEYSGRGGLTVMTTALLIAKEQFEQYENHAVDVARTAMALGHLILRPDSSESLPTVTMPKTPLALRLPVSDWSDNGVPRLPAHAVQWVARESCSLLRDNRRVMIVGPCDPLPILTLLLDQLSAEERPRISFACGLKPSNRREFCLQFTHQEMTPKLQRELARQGIEAIDLVRVLAETR
jgi:hypothetical protein